MRGYVAPMALNRTPFDIDRFREAQDYRDSFATAMVELHAGRKATHWIWWVFPQVRGLGTSATSVRYALDGREEASAYLADETLRRRWLEAAMVVHDQLLGPNKVPLERLMGSEIDALKLVSSMTLFAEVATSPAVRDLSRVGELRKTAEEILGVAGYPRCERTLATLRHGHTFGGPARKPG